MPLTLTAGSTGEAYALSNCDDYWETGAVFVVESEQVVGIAWAWPVAVTAASGELHTTDRHPSQWDGVEMDPAEEDIPVLAAAADRAIAEATRRGWTLAPWASAHLTPTEDS